MDGIELDNEHDGLSTIFGVLEQLSAIDLETKRDTRLPVVELSAKLEIHCEICAQQKINEQHTYMQHMSTMMWLTS